MAFVTLRRAFCPTSAFWMPGAVVALKIHPANHVQKVVTARLRVWFCPLQPQLFRVRFHHAYCKNFHSENGNDLPPVGEPWFPQAQDWNQPEPALKTEDEEMAFRRLSALASCEEVLSFLSTLDTLPVALASAALLRIWEIEKRDGKPRLPKAVLEDRVFQALCLRCEQDPSPLTDAALVTALQSLVMLRPVDPQNSLMPSLMAECQRRLRRGGLEVHHLCVLGESLAKRQGASCETLELVICQLQRKNLETFAPEDIVSVYRILQACPEELDKYQTFLNTVNNFSISIVPYLSPKSISRLLAALVALDQAHARPLLIKLGKYVVRHIPRFTNDELRKVLEAFVYFGHSDRFFTEALEQHVAALCLSLEPAVASSVMEYCSRKRILSKPIFDVVAEIFVCQSEKFSPSQISELIEPFGKLNYLPPNAPALFRKVEHVLFTHFHHFPPEMLLRLLHSCALLERLPVNFMSRIFSPFFLQRLQGKKSYLDRLSLAQLTQLFLTSVLECPFYKGPKLLPKYQVKSFLTPCCSLETPMDLHLYKSVVIGLIDLLGSRLYFASKVLTPYYYTIDVEIKLDEDGFVLPFTMDEDIHKRVALCIDGPHRFCLGSKHLLGKEAIKQRHLRLLGYQVVQIPYHELDLLTSRLELVDYLQRKLFSQSSTVHW
ncbi:FAST kinase domain-containing protein 3, mitochondrial [Apodemus sylvaticus]|uniref:FAST kinase domain-containing protein 3, mitochondrial n=1 Tax=Apodemus sylvaticus TaxID=10129 RepID=UPI002242E078|nr:FAST kinase domain-containing protein 3, mitochondrial [Apodemus sylvaticus]XP_052015827.1 FAST kinase domain-containing protein 3, mitochondrial [Apodemus sylvaticus]